MKVFIDSYENLKNTEPLTITIGNFDGLHLGHQELINRTVSFYDTKPALLTFNPHPAKVLKNVKHQELTSMSQKISLLEQTPLQYAYFVNFTREFSNLSAEEFISFLKGLAVKRVVVGRDFRFGAYASGTIEDLKKHFLVEVVDDVLINNTRISSTYIKDLIYSGEIEKAKKLLGRYYEIEGKVIHGDKVGRTLGIPTANLDYEDFVLPKNGVYYCLVDLDGVSYGGALNIGYNPTINYSENKRAEVNILNFEKEIYNQVLKIKIIKFLRPELKFNSKEELVSQMQNDLRECERLFQAEKELHK